MGFELKRSYTWGNCRFLDWSKILNMDEILPRGLQIITDIIWKVTEQVGKICWTNPLKFMFQQNVEAKQSILLNLYFILFYFKLHSYQFSSRLLKRGSTRIWSWIEFYVNAVLRPEKPCKLWVSPYSNCSAKTAWHGILRNLEELSFIAYIAYVDRQSGQKK